MIANSCNFLSPSMLLPLEERKLFTKKWTSIIDSIINVEEEEEEEEEEEDEEEEEEEEEEEDEQHVLE